MTTGIVGDAMRHERLIAWGLAVAVAGTANGQQLPTPAAPVTPQFQGRPVPPIAIAPLPPAATTNFRAVYPPPAAVAGAMVPTPTTIQLQPPNPLPADTGFVPLKTAVAPKAAPATLPSSVAQSLTVEKRCPETVNLGASLIYEIILRNVGTTPVYHVRIEDELPPTTRYIGSEPAAEVRGERLGWQIGSLEAGAERKVRVEVMPGSEGDYRADAMVTFSAVASLKTAIVRPRLEIAATCPETAVAGDPAPISIRVNNPGTGPVTNLVLRVKLPAGLQHPNGNYIEADLGTLAAGDSKTVPLRTIASTGGAQVAEVAATGDGVPEASAKAAVTVQQPIIQVRLTSPAKVNFKGEVASEIEVTNPGNAAAGNVTVVHTLPAGLEFANASDGGLYDPSSRAVTWRIGSHPAGTRKALSLRSKATVVGDQAIRIAATADRGIETRTEGVVAVEGIPALMLEVVDLEDPIEVGGDLTYEVRVVNQGSCPCTNIQITAQVPEGLAAQDATGPTAYRVNGASVVFEPLPKLATKADVVFRIRVKGVQPGDYRFKVQLTCDQLKTPVNKEEASRIYK